MKRHAKIEEEVEVILEIENESYRAQNTAESTDNGKYLSGFRVYLIYSKIQSVFWHLLMQVI